MSRTISRRTFLTGAAKGAAVLGVVAAVGVGEAKAPKTVKPAATDRRSLTVSTAIRHEDFKDCALTVVRGGSLQSCRFDNCTIDLQDGAVLVDSYATDSNVTAHVEDTISIGNVFMAGGTVGIAA